MSGYHEHQRFLASLFFALLVHVAAAFMLIPMLSLSKLDAEPRPLSVVMLQQEQPAASRVVQSRPEPVHLRPKPHQTMRLPSMMVLQDSLQTVAMETIPAPPQAEAQEPAAEVVATAPSIPQPAPAAAASPSGPVTPPQFNADYLSNPAPEYPDESRVQREEGVVSLRVHVTEAGRPDEITMHRSSSFARLDQASIEAVWRWKFVPGYQDGKAVAAWVIVPIRFTLRK